MVKRTLITTSDERTWPSDLDEPVLFLGEWCRRYSRKDIWQSMNAEVVPYHWDDRIKLRDDYRYLQELYERLLDDLSGVLNGLHQSNHSLKYWKILIGPWLGNFTQALFDRWYMLRYAIENYNVSKVYILKREPRSVVPNDMNSFERMVADDDWNEAVYAQLLRRYWSGQVDIIEINNDLLELVAVKETKGLKQWVRTLSIHLLQQCYRLSTSSDNYFFLSSCLPIEIDLNLQVRLGQFPKIWRTQDVPTSEVKSGKREWRLRNDERLADNFSSVAYNFTSHHIPSTYVEGYKSLFKIPKRLKWPVSPKVIFTSNAYWGDDVFKQYAAEHVEKGAKLVIGQHGGHFGMTPFAFHEQHQIDVADKWLSWGWSDPDRAQVKPVGKLISCGRTAKYDPKGGALMVEMSTNRYSYHLYAATVSRQWLDYFQEQQRFLTALPEDLRKRVLLRLYAHDCGWDQIERWKDTGLDVPHDVGHSDIKTLIQKSRICISTYNATTYLQSLSWNIPTIIFWKPEHWEVNEEVKPYFQMLINADILHFAPESAAGQMVRVWDDMDTWWQSSSVQTARVKFCEQYAASIHEPVTALADLMKKTS